MLLGKHNYLDELPSLDPALHKYITLYILHPTPYTLHPTPYTLHRSRSGSVGRVRALCRDPPVSASVSLGLLAQVLNRPCA